MVEDIPFNLKFGLNWSICACDLFIRLLFSNCKGRIWCQVLSFFFASDTWTESKNFIHSPRPRIVCIAFSSKNKSAKYKAVGGLVNTVWYCSRCSILPLQLTAGSLFYHCMQVVSNIQRQQVPVYVDGSMSWWWTVDATAWQVPMSVIILTTQLLSSGGGRVSGARGHRSFWRPLRLSPPLSSRGLRSRAS